MESTPSDVPGWSAFVNGLMPGESLQDREVIQRFMQQFKDHPEIYLVSWRSDPKAPRLTEEILRQHQYEFNFRVDDDFKSPSRKVFVFTNDPAFFRQMEIFNVGVDLGTSLMKVKPRKQERDAEIVRLHDVEGLDFGAIKKELRKINPEWVTKSDGSIVSVKALKEAYRRKKDCD